MQKLPNLGSDLHEVMLARSMDVYRGDNLGFRQLPDMELVHAMDTFDLANGFIDFLKRDVGGYTLQEDKRGTLDWYNCEHAFYGKCITLLTKGQSGRKDDDSYDERDDRVKIESPTQMR